MNEERPPKIVLNFKPKKKIRRHRRTWMEGIKKAIEKWCLDQNQYMDRAQ